MKLAVIAVFALITLDHAHLCFPESLDFINMVYFRNMVICLYSILAFKLARKRDINARSIFAVGIVFSFVSLGFYTLWWAFDVNTLYVYPVSFWACLVLLCHNAFKHYEYPSDKIIDDHIYICFWMPENAQTIFPSLFGAAIGSVCIYSGGFLYTPEWESDYFKKRSASPGAIEKKYIVFDTGRRPSQMVDRELKKLLSCRASIGGVKLLRFKCVYAIRGVLKAIGVQFSPSLLEFVPAFFAKKILELRNDRRRPNSKA